MVEEQGSRLAVLGGDVYFPVAGDGVRDYSLRLVEALHESGIAADLFWRSRAGVWTKTPGDREAFRSARPREVWRELRTYDGVLVQYDVFRYGSRGFVPWLPARLLQLRRAAPGIKIGVMLHELHLPFHTWRWELKKAWQRMQMVGFQISADVLFCSVEPWVDELRARAPRRAVVYLPVGSNLPDRRRARDWERLRLGARPQTVVMSSFGTDDSPWRLYAYTAHAVNRVARAGFEVTFLNLGGNTPTNNLIDSGVSAIRPGFLPREALAEKIAATDIFLAPFADGVSARRTTVMAALQHAVAVVGTAGRNTGRQLRASDGMRLEPVADPDAFAAEALRLACCPEERRQLGVAGQRLYASTFDWDVCAARIARAFGFTRPERDFSAHAHLGNSQLPAVRSPLLSDEEPSASPPCH